MFIYFKNVFLNLPKVKLVQFRSTTENRNNINIFIHLSFLKLLQNSDLCKHFY